MQLLAHSLALSLFFGWQAISHIFLRYHDSAYKQIAAQDNLINSLSGVFKEDGQYLVPGSNLNASQEEMAKYDEGMKGKSFALITYHAADKSNMGMSAIRSHTTAFLSILILFPFSVIIPAVPLAFLLNVLV